MNKHCVGIVIKDRWDLTYQTLMSLYYCSQSSFDLILIDNGSSSENLDNLKEWMESGLIPVKNLFCLPETPLATAWNLFLAMSKDYRYRTKMDNDLRFFNTPVAHVKPLELQPVSPAKKMATPMMTGTNPGATPVASFVKGAGRQHTKKSSQRTHSAFLDHMELYHKRVTADLIALVPVSPKENFAATYKKLHTVTYKDMPYLFGACMLITKKCFDKLGYFDERLPRKIDIEYSQRALRNGINISYHDFYWVSHIGARQSTDDQAARDEKYRQALFIQDSEPPVECYADSEWELILPKIQKLAQENKVVTFK